MNFIISTTVLLKQLKSIGGVLNSSNTIPILDNFLFEVTPGNLVISASDMETTITTSLKAEAKDSGAIAIPARTLMDTLSNFPEQPLTFSIDKKNFGIKIMYWERPLQKLYLLPVTMIFVLLCVECFVSFPRLIQFSWLQMRINWFAIAEPMLRLHRQHLSLCLKSL